MLFSHRAKTIFHKPEDLPLCIRRVFLFPMFVSCDFFFLMQGLLFRVLVEQKHRYLTFMCCSFLCFYISGLPVKNNRYTTTIIKHTVKLT